MELEVTEVEINRLVHRIRQETLDAISVSLVKVGGWSETRIKRAMQAAFPNLAYSLDEETIRDLLLTPDPMMDAMTSKKILEAAR